MKWRLIRLSQVSCLHRCQPLRLERSRVNISTCANRYQSIVVPISPRSTCNGQATHFSTSTSKRDHVSALTTHANLLRHPPDSETAVRIAGNVHSKRTHKKVAFLFVGDGSTYDPIQAVLKPDNVSSVQNGAYVELQGRWISTQGRKQAYELHVDEVLRIGESDPETSPLQKKSMTVEHLRNQPHLRLRLPLYSLLARVRNEIVNSAHDFYSGSQDLQDAALFVQPPLITSSDCEGAGEVFTVGRKPDISATTVNPQQHGKSETQVIKPFFGTPKYLTVSSQLHLEAYSAELGDVWTLSPTFRAEGSDTARHLAEFYMMEAEFRSLTELSDLTSRTQRMIQYLASRLTSHPLSKELLAYHADPKHKSENESSANFETRWKALDGSQWQSITYADAAKELQAGWDRNHRHVPFNHTWKSGLQLEHERWIVANVAGNKPIFITHYPKDQKPFYMLPSDAVGSSSISSNDTVACFDLLFPFGTCEVVGGSLREHRLEHLIEAMRQKGLLKTATRSSQEIHKDVHGDNQDMTGQKEAMLNSEYPFLRDGESLNTLQWYADLRRFGSSPHGGFGMGFDRLLMYLTGVQNVREVVPFPRFAGRADC